jgi:hypothetical protein
MTPLVRATNITQTNDTEIHFEWRERQFHLCVSEFI